MDEKVQKLFEIVELNQSGECTQTDDVISNQLKVTCGDGKDYTPKLIASGNKYFALVGFIAFCVSCL